MLTQAWRNATFVHWPLDPAVAVPLLPAGVRPDTLDGVTQVGLAAFHMERIGMARAPGVPYLGTFAETNVRLYTVDGAGRRGVFFLSLDASRLVPVLAGRALGVPYSWARMRIGTGPRYATRRRWPGPRATSRLAVRTGAPITAPSELERFVTARWGLHLALRTGTAYWPNEHPEWPLHRTELVELDDGLVAAAGLPAPAGPPSSVLWSPGVQVRFGPRRPVDEPALRDRDRPAS